ncbi:hypothetical protein AAJ76_5000134148 [Vairimorpha ceranae]|uniref:Uncharacterized protein n=1 Tax=Vairimorpha ceranae TaxID=40302 RepID=A0A0F9ZG00_9MICR|nr:hypothetical protein AAJ76_5000134148 [Vairimorpha ceranae]KKO76294.1 hypothetical protein AAJ76_5000134148 [Vairimorpha ceranae]
MLKFLQFRLMHFEIYRILTIPKFKIFNPFYLSSVKKKNYKYIWKIQKSYFGLKMH